MNKLVRTLTVDKVTLGVGNQGTVRFNAPGIVIELFFCDCNSARAFDDIGKEKKFYRMTLEEIPRFELETEY